MALAHAWLRTGKVRRCLVGATETLTNLTVRGFGCFSLLSPKVAAPFAVDRAGINLSEGAAWFVLEAEPTPRALAYLRGGATNLDAFDMTRPHPSGRGLYRAMQGALAVAGVSPAAIDWVYAHGTGTLANDAAESAAIAAIFGEHAPLVSSTKGVHGHALAASGLIELAAALGALAEDVVLPTGNVKASDPALPVRLVLEPTPRPLAHVLKTTLGFGGVNAALVLSKEAARTATPTTRRAAPTSVKILATKAPLVVGAGAAGVAESLPLLERDDFRKATLSMAMAHVAVEQALAMLPEAQRESMEKWGVVVGVGHGELEVTKDFLVTLATRGVARPFLFQNALHNAVLGFLSLRYGIQGPGATTSTHHFAGEDALDLGAELIKAGECDFCLVVGVEATPAEMLPVVAELLAPRATPGAGAGAIVLASADLGLSGLRLATPSCARDPQDVDQATGGSLLAGYHGGDAVRHVALAARAGRTGELHLRKADGTAARISLG
jgi:3-oxoacyl-(acyl-carrier-protein) synthase